ncbi:MAG: SMC-Scp complex subunit ScpB [Planctomycetaceae bacterium]|jgi:segregation and condensation protein B|nr:SMC-Scp complex subunit ScpB [Planctomycetaceae bacterium]
MRTTNDDLAKRFGAASFTEYIDDGEDNEEPAVLSLDALRAAFAGAGTTTAPEAEGGEQAAEEEPDEGEPETEDEENEPLLLLSGEGYADVSPKSILEAMLFVGGRNQKPLSAEQAAEKMRNVSPAEIEQVVLELNQTYSLLNCPYEIRQEPEGYRLVLRSGFEPVQEKFYGKIRETVLSQPAIDTLAVVAYRQPLTADEVQKIRRQPSAALLNQLVKRGLLTKKEETVNSSEKKKKGIYYRTTQRFLNLFHLKSLDDLPMPEDIVY